MTIRRLFTLTAERQKIDDVTFFLPPSGTVLAISNTKVNTGDYSYRLPSAGQAFGRPFTSMSAIRVGYWLNHIGMNPGGLPSLFCVSAGSDLDGSPVLRLDWSDSEGVLRLRRAAGTGAGDYENLATAAPPASLLAQNTWIHLGFTLYSHATLGFFSMYVNGVQILNHTGDTQLARWYIDGGHHQELSTTFHQVHVAGRVSALAVGWASSAYVDDVYADTYDGEVDAPVPMRRFEERIANGAGTNAQWTPLSSTNVSQVDDGEPNGGAPDDDTTYVKAESAGLRDTFTKAAISPPSGYRVVALNVFTHGKTLDIGPKINHTLYDGSIYADGDDLTPPLDYTTEQFHRFTTMPDGSAFTTDGVNDLEIGYRSRGSYA